MKRLIIAGAAASLITTASHAELSKSFSNVENLRINDFTGRVEIAVDGKDAAVLLSDGKKKYPVDVSVENGVLTIAGEKRPKHYKLYKEIDWERYGEKAFEKYLEDYPVLKVTLPKGAGVVFDDAIVSSVSGDIGGDLSVDGGYVEAIFGDHENADVGISGAGDISLGDVSGMLKASIGGSGDFDAQSAGRAVLRIGGSGDIEVGQIDGPADLKIGGSGDIRIVSVGGPIAVSIGGSGDVGVGNVAGGGELSVAGSGDIALGSINGKTSVRIAGNGDIDINEGRAEDLDISIAGSGDFEFGGVSTNLNVSVIGSGSINIARNEGTFRNAGRGHVIIGGKSYTNDD